MAQPYCSTAHDSAHSGRGLFQPIDLVDSRGKSFWTSLALHGVLLLVLLALPLIYTDTMKVKYDVVLLAPPPPHRQILEVTHWKQPPLPKPEVRVSEKQVALAPRKPLLAELKPPEPPKRDEANLPPVIEKEKPLPLARNAPRMPEPNIPTPLPPKPEIRTNVFSSATSAEHVVKLPARDVQTGGFGDPNGVRGDGKPEKQVNVASLGSFDLPVGDGAGSGTGGPRGTRGVVTNAGFGSGVAPVNPGSSSGRTVSQGSFGDVEAAPSAAGPKKKDSGPPQKQAEILFKPRPDYTDEARKIKLEGEVLLRVLFTSTGEVQVLNVVRGLGHGLDESAIRAAQQIRFKPARREGQPVDSTANLYIIFQLAY